MRIITIHIFQSRNSKSLVYGVGDFVLVVRCDAGMFSKQEIGWHFAFEYDRFLYECNSNGIMVLDNTLAKSW